MTVHGILLSIPENALDIESLRYTNLSHQERAPNHILIFIVTLQVSYNTKGLHMKGMLEQQECNK